MAQCPPAWAMEETPQLREGIGCHSDQADQPSTQALEMSSTTFPICIRSPSFCNAADNVETSSDNELTNFQHWVAGLGFRCQMLRMDDFLDLIRERLLNGSQYQQCACLCKRQRPTIAEWRWSSIRSTLTHRLQRGESTIGTCDVKK